MDNYNSKLSLSNKAYNYYDNSFIAQFLVTSFINLYNFSCISKILKRIILFDFYVCINHATLWWLISFHIVTTCINFHNNLYLSTNVSIILQNLIQPYNFVLLKEVTISHEVKVLVRKAVEQICVYSHIS